MSSAPLSLPAGDPAGPALVAAHYTAHTGRRYSYTLRWHFDAPFVRWSATVTNYLGEMVASRSGRIQSRLFAGEEVEPWVRAAVELVIERLAAEDARA